MCGPLPGRPSDGQQGEAPPNAPLGPVGFGSFGGGTGAPPAFALGIGVPGVNSAGVARLCPPGMRAGAMAGEELPDRESTVPDQFLIHPKIADDQNGARAGAVTDASRAPPMGGSLEINAIKSLANELHAQTRREDAQTPPPPTHTHTR